MRPAKVGSMSSDSHAWRLDLGFLWSFGVGERREIERFIPDSDARHGARLSSSLVRGVRCGNSRWWKLCF